MQQQGQTHAYAQAPWRLRTQKGALFLIGMFLVGSVVWIMLSISVEASEAGLDIQVMTAQEQTLMREVADLKSRVAAHTASGEMLRRAAEMGFHPASAEDLTYVMVSGYAGRQTILSAPPPGEKSSSSFISPQYAESLSEWLFKGILRLSEKQGELLR